MPRWWFPWPMGQDPHPPPRTTAGEEDRKGESMNIEKRDRLIASPKKRLAKLEAMVIE